MNMLSFRAALTLRGRKFKGLRGWAGKPLHPALTDVPVGAYMLAAAFRPHLVRGPGPGVGPRLLPGSHVRPHRGGRRVDPDRPHRVLGLAQVDGEGHAGPAHGQTPTPGRW